MALEGCSLSMELEGGEDITMHGQAHRRRTAPNAEFTQQERVFRGSWCKFRGRRRCFLKEVSHDCESQMEWRRKRTGRHSLTWSETGGTYSSQMETLTRANRRMVRDKGMVSSLVPTGTGERSKHSAVVHLEFLAINYGRVVFGHILTAVCIGVLYR